MAEVLPVGKEISDVKQPENVEPAAAAPVPDTSSTENTNTQGVSISEIKAVLDATIPPEIKQRHPLQNRWALWYLKGDRAKDWEDCLKQVSLFDTVEDFWALYNHIQPASGLGYNSDFYLFKEGIKPMWEDPYNINGGRWLVLVNKQTRQQKLDIYWQELMMAVIGEQFDDLGEHICGAVVNVRQKGDKVALWTRESAQEQVNTRIGYILKEKLNIPDSEQIRYEVHKENSSRVGSMVKPRLVIPMRDNQQEGEQKRRQTDRERTTSQSK